MHKKDGVNLDCSSDERGGGILAYQHANVGTDNQQNVPNIVPPDNQTPMNRGRRSDDFTGQGWQQLPTRERSSGPDNCNQGIIPPMLYSGYVENREGEVSTSSATDGPSNRPTPNSSSGSDNRQSGHMGNSNSRTSFDTSPIRSHQSLGSQAEIDAAAAFFQMSGGSGITPEQYGSGETPGNDFTVSNGWTRQTGMTPVAEGMLQQLMGDMPMDLRWDSGT